MASKDWPTKIMKSQSLPLEINSEQVVNIPWRFLNTWIVKISQGETETYVILDEIK